MIPFSSPMAAQAVLYFPATQVTAARGAVQSTYPASGIDLTTSVQSKTTRQVGPNGALLVHVSYFLYFTIDPSALNGSLGIRRDDKFTWLGLNLIAKTPQIPVLSGDIAVWRVECEIVK